MDEIINSIMQTPDNTNPNVLRSQLQGMASSSSGVLVVHVKDGVLDKTWQEIVDADLAVLKSDGETGGSATVITSWEVDGGYYVVHAGGDTYAVDSASDYPVKTNGGSIDAPVT